MRFLRRRQQLTKKNIFNLHYCEANETGTSRWIIAFNFTPNTHIYVVTLIIWSLLLNVLRKKIYDQTKTAHTFQRKKNKYTKQVQIESLTRKIKKSNKMVLLSHWLFVMYWLNESLGFLCHFFLHNHSTPIQYSDYWIIKQPFDMIDAQPNAMNWIHFFFVLF